MDDIYLCEGRDPEQPLTQVRWRGEKGAEKPTVIGVGGPEGWDRFYGLRPHGRYEEPYGNKDGSGLSKTDAAIAGGALCNTAGTPTALLAAAKATPTGSTSPVTSTTPAGLGATRGMCLRNKRVPTSDVRSGGGKGKGNGAGWKPALQRPGLRTPTEQICDTSDRKSVV
mgnify:CR=1 FL=1